MRRDPPGAHSRPIQQTNASRPASGDGLVNERTTTMARAVGIDLGTTNSAIAVLEGGEPTIIPNAEGARTTPSVVAFSKTGEVLVGEIAKRQAVTNVDRTISSVKRHMGTDWTTEIDGKKYTAQEISARILMKLKADAEAYLGEPVTEAVITVPAYFNDAQRQATKDAGQIAGLKVERIVNEPTAAALAYGLEKGKEDELILVFDLGGGTFDVSLLEVGKDDDGFSTIQVRATSGDNNLGGDDWDQRIVNWLIDQVKAKTGADLSKDAVALQRLKEAAEQAKKELSSATSTNISLQYLSMTADGPIHLDESLTRAKFEELTSDLLERTKKPFRDVMAEAGVTVSEIDHVVLVGGSTRMPAVTEVVKELTGGREPNKGVNPDEVVAVGAALQASPPCSSRSTRVSVSSPVTTSCSAPSSSPASPRLPAACRRSRSPSTSTRTASSTSPRRTVAPARSSR